jgi:hypothetical protein
MQITGTDFDTSPTTFTLGALFTMNLHNFGNEIEEMCVSAEKELKIEGDVVTLVGRCRLSLSDPR